MKVLILTQPLGPNYGGILQAYALQRFFKKNNSYVETIDWNFCCKKSVFCFSFLINLFKNIIFKCKGKL